MMIFGNGPGVYLPPEIDEDEEEEEEEEEKEEQELKQEQKEPKETKRLKKKPPRNANKNNHIYGSNVSVDSLNPRHRNCFLERPDYARGVTSSRATFKGR